VASIILPRPLARLFAEADRIWQSLGADLVTGWRGFVPANYPEIYLALKRLRGRGPAGGGTARFLEWGSGIGTVTIMADLLGFESYGIEIDPDLVARAESLAARFESGATFVEGTFFPDGYRPPRGAGGAKGVRTKLGGRPGYDVLGLDVSDFDVVYAYPWPGEETLYEDIFDRHARPGATLVCYHSLDHVSVRAARRRR
jgi:hypothetical protein